MKITAFSFRTPQMSVSAAAKAGGAAALALTLLPGVAMAHPWFEPEQALPGQVYETKLHLPHGCDTKGTISVKMRLPATLTEVKAKPSGKWQPTVSSKTTEKGTEQEITWEGGLVKWDEDGVFEWSAKVSGDVKAGTTLYIPVIQNCEGGAANRWIEIAKSKQDHPDYPAAELSVVDKIEAATGAPADKSKMEHHHHHH